MGTIIDAFTGVFRRYNTDGVPASGPRKPVKSDAQGLGAIIETYVTTAIAAVSSALTSGLALKADKATTIGSGGLFVGSGNLGASPGGSVKKQTLGEMIAGTADDGAATALGVAAAIDSRSAAAASTELQAMLQEVLTNAGLTINEAGLAALSSGPSKIFLDFAAGTTALLAVTRADSAAYFDAAGKLVTLPANVSRYTHDPLSGERIGLLVEGSGGSNHWSRSTEADDVSWGKNSLTITANVGGITDPAGGTNADKLVEVAASANHQITKTASFSALGADTTFTEWRIFKAAERTRVQLVCVNAKGGTGTAVFDLATGVVDPTYTLNCSPFAVRLANDWILCGITFVIASGATSSALYVRLVTTGQTTTYLGDGTSGVYLYQAQGRQGQILDMPILTTSAAGTRGADVATVDVSPWFRSGANGIVVNARARYLDGSMMVAQIDDGTESNRIRFWRDDTGKGRLLVTAGGSQQCNIDLGAWANNTDRQIAISLFEGSIRCAVNGVTTYNAAIGTMPTGLATLRLGTDSAGAGPTTIIRKVAAWPRSLSDAELLTKSRRRADPRLFCIGNSFTAGTNAGVTPGNEYPTLLGRTMRRGAHNAGVGGETTAQIKTRFLTSGDYYNRIVIIEAGRNDGSNQAAIESGIADMVAALPPGSRYLVISVPFALNDNGTALAYIAATNAALSATYGNRFLAVNWSTVTRDGGQLHPDSAGNATFAAAVRDKIYSLGW